MEVTLHRELGMKPAASFRRSGRLLLALGLLWATLGCPTGYAVEKLGMAPYNASVAHTSAADRLQITTVLAEVAGAYGMKKVGPLTRTLAFYTSLPSGLGLTMSASDIQDNGTVNITITPTGLGIKLNAQRKAAIAAVDAGLRRAFGDRLKK